MEHHIVLRGRVEELWKKAMRGTGI